MRQPCLCSREASSFRKHYRTALVNRVGMCGGCVEKEYPNRGNICLENGSFLLNFTGCAVCNKRDFMLITNKSLKEEDGEEIVTYDHLCKNCHHVVARHEYTFSIMDEFQLCNCTIVGFMSVSLPIATILAEHGNSDKEVIFVFPNRHVELSNSVVSIVEYTMLCLLCGKAEDTISILPDDPRQMTLLF